ncbi:MAG: ChbG/HpnK family deacetylase [Archangiaceae bacterium]|nr:ChbG/HpnK family deacetylase [Archangiaceae bacterium]
MIRLVVNADDLGLHPRIDEGILRAHSEGIVTSASLLVAGRNAPRAARAAREAGLPLGVHLCLTSHLTPSAPPSAVRWLAPGGRFRRDWGELSTAWLAGLIPAAEIELELTAQLERAREQGVEPDHLDVHQHVHLMPGLARIVERLAERRALPLRWPRELPRATWLRRPSAWAKAALLSTLGMVRPARGARRVKAVGLFDSGGLSEARLLKLLSRLGEGDWELMCHPGLGPGTVPEDPAWRYDWEAELAALCSPRVREVLRKREITLVSYRALAA